MYRNPDGLKCGGGLFIPDEQYFPALETKLVIQLPKFFAKIGYVGDQLAVINQIQYIHDAFMVERWSEQLELLRGRVRKGLVKVVDTNAWWLQMTKDNPGGTYHLPQAIANAVRVPDRPRRLPPK